MTKIKETVATLEGEARALATGYAERAELSALDAAYARTAGRYIQIAEKSARLVPRKEAEAMASAHKTLLTESEQRVYSAILNGDDATGAAAREVAYIDRIRDELQEKMEGYAERAWKMAIEDLEAMRLGKPSRTSWLHPSVAATLNAE